MDKGARSDNVDRERCVLGLMFEARGGEELRMWVEEVGTGVGYVRVSSKASRVRFSGRGSAGEEEKSSNAGSNDAAAFLA